MGEEWIGIEGIKGMGMGIGKGTEGKRTEEMGIDVMEGTEN